MSGARSLRVEHGFGADQGSYRRRFVVKAGHQFCTHHVYMYDECTIGDSGGECSISQEKL